MNKKRRAIIDIGTNSVKLLVADVAGYRIDPIYEASEQTRLGRGFYKNHFLQPEAIEATARVVGEFAAKASELGAAPLRVAATSATRDARNREHLQQAIWDAARTALEVIDGEQEADLTLKSVTMDARFHNKSILVVEVGGGSTQVLYRPQEGGLIWRHSFRLGAVRLLEQNHPSDPPSAEDLFRCRAEVGQFVSDHIRPKMPAALDRHAWFVGIGGTSVCLAMIQEKMREFDAARLEKTQIGAAAMSSVVDSLWSMTLDERRKLAGLPPPRADVILTGAVIYESVMNAFMLSRMHLSVRGWRYAALMEEDCTPVYLPKTASPACNPSRI